MKRTPGFTGRFLFKAVGNRSNTAPRSAS